MNAHDACKVDAAEVVQAFVQIGKAANRHAKRINVAFKEFAQAYNWYAEQTAEWNKLKEAGWRFGHPQKESDSVGIRIERNEVSAEFRVPRSYSFRRIHTSLLMSCKQFAACHWI